MAGNGDEERRGEKTLETGHKKARDFAAFGHLMPRRAGLTACPTKSQGGNIQAILFLSCVPISHPPSSTLTSLGAVVAHHASFHMSPISILAHTPTIGSMSRARSCTASFKAMCHYSPLRSIFCFLCPRAKPIKAAM